MNASLRRALAAALTVLVATPSVFAQAPTPPAPPSSSALPAASASAAPPLPAVSAVAAAPSTPSLGDTLTGSARQDYEAARLLFGDHDYAGALVKFQSAYDQSKEPRLLFNMGACEKNLRHYAKTIADFERYRAEAAASLTQADRDEVDRYLAELRPFVGSVSVASNEEGANVYVDDELLGVTPLRRSMRLDLGARRLRVTKGGFTEVSTTIMVKGAEEMQVEAHIEPIAHAGRVVVHAGANDAISIDGQPVGTGQYDGRIASGGHQLKVTADGMLPYQSEVVIQDDQTRSIDITLESQAHGGLPAWVWITGSVVIAGGLAVGGYFLFRPQDQSTPAVFGTMNPGTVQLSSFR